MQRRASGTILVHLLRPVALVCFAGAVCGCAGNRAPSASANRSPHGGANTIANAKPVHNGPADPSGRIGQADADWNESAAGWEQFESVETLSQASFGQDGADFDPDLSPDGKWLVYASTQHRLTSDLYIKAVDGQAVTQITSDEHHDLMPSFSPDGSRVAFASNRGGSWDIFVVGVEGGQPVQITTEGSHELHPTWSPDGKRLAYSRLSPTSGRWELWVVEATNTGRSQFLGYGLLPEWCPTGDKIAFQRSRERGDRLYSVWTIDYTDGESRNPTEIASSPEWAFINPTWSPDGQRLAFSAVKNPASDITGGVSPAPRNADLWMVNVDGSGRIRLTSGQYADLMPDWSADGRIFFVSNRGGIENIFSLTPTRAIETASFTPRPGANGTAQTPANAPMPSESHAPMPAPPAHAAAPHHEPDHAPAPGIPPMLQPPANDGMAEVPDHDDHHDDPHQPH